MTCETSRSDGLGTTDFRRVSARLVAALTASVGAARLDLAEDAAQDALLRALGTWPVRGVPERPEAWLVRAARNALVDRLRREKGGAEKAAAAAASFGGETIASAAAEAERRDDPAADPALLLLFLCCRPEVPRESRAALALRECCGFGSREIASALRVSNATIAQRLVRAKRTLRDVSAPFEAPGADELRARLDDVRDVVYALFTEGARATEGPALIREDLVAEALRLSRLLCSAPAFDDPSSRALRALICLHAARMPARIDSFGGLATLAEQDRALFDRALLNEGFAAFSASMAGGVVSRFHVEASLASLHASAPSFEETDWAAVLDRYDDLTRLSPGPVVALNRVVAVAMARGVDAAAADLDAVACDAALAGDGLVFATRAFLEERRGAYAAAAASWRAAAEKATNEPEATYCRRRAERAEARGAPGGRT